MSVLLRVFVVLCVCFVTCFCSVYVLLRVFVVLCVCFVTCCCSAVCMFCYVLL